MLDCSFSLNRLVATLCYEESQVLYLGKLLQLEILAVRGLFLSSSKYSPPLRQHLSTCHIGKNYLQPALVASESL